MKLQNICTKDFNLLGTVESQWVADDRSILSYVIQTDAGYPTTRHWSFLRPLMVTTPAEECISDPDIQNSGEEITETNLHQNADKREQSADTQAQPRPSTRTTQHPVRLGSSEASVKCTRPSLNMGGGCSSEDRKKLADFEKKVTSLEKLILDHTGKMSSSSQFTQGRSNQTNKDGNTLLGWRSLKRSSVEVVNQAMIQRLSQ